MINGERVIQNPINGKKRNPRTEKPRIHHQNNLIHLVQDARPYREPMTRRNCPDTTQINGEMRAMILEIIQPKMEMEVLRRKSRKLTGPRTKILAIGTIVTNSVIKLVLIYSLMKQERDKRE